MSISIGDSFVKKAPDRQSKLTSKFSGPSIVTEKLHINKFKIKDNILNISEIVHVDRLKKVDIPVPSPHLSQPPLSSPHHLWSCTTVFTVSLVVLLDERAYADLTGNCGVGLLCIIQYIV